MEDWGVSAGPETTPLAEAAEILRPRDPDPVRVAQETGSGIRVWELVLVLESGFRIQLKLLESGSGIRDPETGIQFQNPETGI